MTVVFDAIIVGSGITGGWAAKELTEKGLKVLMIERGPMIEHQSGYTTEMSAPWELEFHGFGDQKLFDRDYPQQQGLNFSEWTKSHFVNDRENPYLSSGPAPFQWRRGYQLGGRSLTWGRQCYRWSDIDFSANLRDGHGVDWPVRYADLAPWYDHVERFIGVSGSKEGLPQLPDGQFQPPMALNIVETHFKQKVEAAYPERRVIIGRAAHLTEELPGRTKCQYRNICARGCSFGGYFSTQSSTLPAARATGNLTLITDTLVEAVDCDPKTRRVTGVRTLDTRNGARATYSARLIFLNASTINTVALLLRSRSEAFPNGLANSSGVLGQYLMDHAGNMVVRAKIDGFDAHTYFGNRPNGVVIPRFRNVGEPSGDMLRGYSYQGGAFRQGWSRGEMQPGVGADYKASLRGPGDWILALGAFAECLPRAENRITLDRSAVDRQGLPMIRVEMSFGENERKLVADAQKQALAMVKLVNATVIATTSELGRPGNSVHEMGGARMGRDPKTSVLNGHNQAHDVANLFVTDGAAMASSGNVNPSLTYMALTARACDAAVSMLKENAL